MQTKNGTEYYSLYEYLGYAAGKELGGEVYDASIKTKQPIVKQYVAQGNYKGNVHCYTKGFLDEYFYTIENKEPFNKYPEPEPEEEDLPF
tara:strand:- start:107 stop:376 length:270 start_codon:yes stop_codon:yes gene_type:complete